MAASVGMTMSRHNDFLEGMINLIPARNYVPQQTHEWAVAAGKYARHTKKPIESAKAKRMAIKEHRKLKLDPDRNQTSIKDLLLSRAEREKRERDDALAAADGDDDDDEDDEDDDEVDLDDDDDDDDDEGLELDDEIDVGDDDDDDDDDGGSDDDDDDGGGDDAASGSESEEGTGGKRKRLDKRRERAAGEASVLSRSDGVGLLQMHRPQASLDELRARLQAKIRELRERRGAPAEETEEDKQQRRAKRQEDKKDEKKKKREASKEKKKLKLGKSDTAAAAAASDSDDSDSDGGGGGGGGAGGAKRKAEAAGRGRVVGKQLKAENIDENADVLFSTLDYSSGKPIPAYLAPAAAAGAKPGDDGKRPRRVSKQQLLAKATKQKQLLEQLRGTEEGDKQQWQKAMDKLHGDKFKDDPTRIKKSIARDRAKKAKSAREWGERKRAEADAKKKKQDKRAANIQRRRDAKAGGGGKKRAGFEGRKRPGAAR